MLDLQEQGFTLGALRTLLEAWERGATLEEVLGLPSRSPRARSQDPEPLDPVEEFFGRCHPRQGFLSAVPSPLSAVACLGSGRQYPVMSRSRVGSYRTSG